MGFYVAVLHRRQRVSIFKDLFRFLKSFFDVPVFHPKHTANVAAQREIEFLAVHARVGLVALRMRAPACAGLGGFEKIEDRRQLFVIDFDQIQSLFRNFPVLRRHERDDFTDVTHSIRCDDGLIIDNGPEIRIQPGQVIARDNGYDTGEFFRLACDRRAEVSRAGRGFAAPSRKSICGRTRSGA